VAAILKKVRDRAIGAGIGDLRNVVAAGVDQSRMIRDLRRGFVDVLEALNREIVPVLKQATSEVNRVGGDIQTKDAAYEIQTSDRVVLLVDGTALDVTLPLVANFENQPLLVKKKGAAAVNMRLVPQTGETIDGAANLTVAQAYGAVEVFSDGVEWHLISGGNGSAGDVRNTTRVTTTYTILATDEIIYCDTDGGGFTATLPAGVVGTTYRIINVGSTSNDLTLAVNGTDKLSGVASGTETIADGESIELTYETTEGWW
jgi:hypothetical protein